MSDYSAAYHLEPSGVAGEENTDKLIRYLDGRIFKDDFFQSNEFDREDLQAALELAVLEIAEHYDANISILVGQAQGDDCRTEVTEEAFVATRQTDWAALAGTPFNSIDQNAIIDYLKKARTEITWLKNECGRLELHIANNRTMIQQGRRKSFTYHPQPRTTWWGTSDSASICPEVTESFMSDTGLVERSEDEAVWISVNACFVA